jgi:hypothetical protein
MSGWGDVDELDMGFGEEQAASDDEVVYDYEESGSEVSDEDEDETEVADVFGNGAKDGGVPLQTHGDNAADNRCAIMSPPMRGRRDLESSDVSLHLIAVHIVWW